MRVLVTGGAGFIGRVALNALIPDRTVTTFEAGLPDAIAWRLDSENASARGATR